MKAACLHMPHLFFNPHVCDSECDGPDGCTAGRQEQGRYERIRRARELCASCPVTSECLEYAMTLEIKHGMWGGHTERQRQRLRASKNRNGR